MLLTETGMRDSKYVNRTKWQESLILLRMRRDADTKARVPSVSGFAESMPPSGSVASADFNLVADWIEATVSQPVVTPSASPSPSPAATYVAQPPTGNYFQPALNFSCAGGDTEPSVDPLKRLSRDSLIRSYDIIFQTIANSTIATNLSQTLQERYDALPAEANSRSAIFDDVHVQAWWDLADQATQALVPSAVSTMLPSCTLTATAAAAGGCVRNFLVKLGKVAFSRALTSDEAQAYADTFTTSLQAGETAESSLRMAMMAILVSPQFLFEVAEGTLVAGKTNLYKNSSQWQLALTYLRTKNYRPPISEIDSAATTDYTQSANLAALVDRLLASAYSNTISTKNQAIVANYREWFQPERRTAPPNPADAAYVTIWKDLMGTASAPTATTNQALQSDGLRSAEKTFTLLAQQGATLAQIFGTSQVYADSAALAKVYQVSSSSSLQNSADGAKRGMVWIAANLVNPASNGNAFFFTQGRFIMDAMACQNFSMPAATAGGMKTGAQGSPANDPTFTRTHRERYESAVNFQDCAICHSNGLNVAFVGSAFGKLGQYRAVASKPKELIYDYSGAGTLRATLDANEKYWVRFPGVDRAVSGPGDFVDALVSSGLMQGCFSERVVTSLVRRTLVAGPSSGDACTIKRVYDQLNGGTPAQDAVRTILTDPSFTYYKK